MMREITSIIIKNTDKNMEIIRIMISNIMKKVNSGITNITIMDNKKTLSITL